MMESSEVEDLWKVGALPSPGHRHRTVLAMPSSKSRGLDLSEYLKLLESSERRADALPRRLG